MKKRLALLSIIIGYTTENKYIIEVNSIDIYIFYIKIEMSWDKMLVIQVFKKITTKVHTDTQTHTHLSHMNTHMCVHTYACMYSIIVKSKN